MSQISENSSILARHKKTYRLENVWQKVRNETKLDKARKI